MRMLRCIVAAPAWPAERSARGDYFSTAAIAAALAASLPHCADRKAGLFQYEELDQLLSDVLAQLAPHGVSMHQLEAEQRR
ncbi:MAG: hypothetical protein EOP82_23975 [Variovorax sp.]|nr:MAG: hypothetical protein EOP82_23975 [Variovorax sp.]